MAKSKSGITSFGTTITFLSGRACSDTLFNVISKAYGHPMKTEENAVVPFAGGIMQHGYQCGMIWGATLAAGAQAYRQFGSGPKGEAAAIIAAQRATESFRARKNTINCLDITHLDRSSSTWQMIFFFLIKGGSVGCFRMAAGYAPTAFNEIDAALSEKLEHPDSLPVSCASMVARKLGVSDQHVTMAAGLAGGIGLSGGACGALGAAIWILSMKIIKEQDEKVQYNNPKTLELIEKFIKTTDYQFECSEIVGRKFENIEDHAKYLRDGGCAEIIEELALNTAKFSQ